ncbi:hypothetical protein HanIR_Chr12g0598781 [Helianthus annuus]|nr:hypothetical protein HanIR_Chr12g0598781 [Helianthus annuus]
MRMPQAGRYKTEQINNIKKSINLQGWRITRRQRTNTRSVYFTYQSGHVLKSIYMRAIKNQT